MSGITQKTIVYFGQKCHLYCDGKCYKAWGIASRPRVTIEGKEYWVSDEEFAYAPEDPGTYEGCDGKPFITSGRDMNKWCARACERSCIIPCSEKFSVSQLPNWDKRQEVGV